MKILVIQILRLGDALQLTPIISGLKGVFPDSEIHALTSSLGGKILGAQDGVDHIHEVRIEELSQLAKSSELDDILSALDIIEADLTPVLSGQWDWVINLTYSFASGLIAYLTSGKSCSGFYATPKRQFFAKEKWFAYSIATFLNRKYSCFNWVDINKNIVGVPSVPQRTLFPLDSEVLDRIDLHLKRIGFHDRPLIGFAPGASGEYKKWPIGNFIELAKRLVNHHRYQLLIFGDQDDADRGGQIASAVYAGCENLCGKTSIPELAGYLSKCELLVSNDSGPMHLANSVGTPVVSLFFSTHFVETGPYGPDNFVVFPDIPCFPCAGTANCSSRECLTFIQPETVEKIVCNRRQIAAGDFPIRLEADEGPVAICRSVFDSWGNLDWVPVNLRPVRDRDAVRLLYRTFWLSELCGYDFDGADLQSFLDRSRTSFGPLELQDPARDFFDRMAAGLGQLDALFRQSHILSMQIYHALLKGDQETVARLGEILQQREDEISAAGEHDALSPLIEYINIRLDNMGKADMKHLAIKTAGIYQEAEYLSQRLNRGLDRLIGHLLPNPSTETLERAGAASS